MDDSVNRRNTTHPITTKADHKPPSLHTKLSFPQSYRREYPRALDSNGKVFKIARNVRKYERSTRRIAYQLFDCETEEEPPTDPISVSKEKKRSCVTNIQRLHTWISGI
ncbi:hypothetical protein LOAG_01322 [Loa loa]|uniref:Uncharacterized protein n=1 Tax=Loa loa TaxID=7209 RepID=A0A1S0U9N9_LOALO|nr:hypothetical protein LOAG_01322 [Loa loa]EFO27160.1 hypothetical protein LOAG_01322 [Loa loa]